MFQSPTVEKIVVDSDEEDEAPSGSLSRGTASRGVKSTFYINPLAQRAERNRIASYFKELETKQFLISATDAKRTVLAQFTQRAPPLIDSFPRRKAKNRLNKYISIKTSLQTRLNESQLEKFPKSYPTIYSVVSLPPKYPTMKLCSVCNYQSYFKCMKCNSSYCSRSCLDTHLETRCPIPQ